MQKSINKQQANAKGRQQSAGSNSAAIAPVINIDNVTLDTSKIIISDVANSTSYNPVTNTSSENRLGFIGTAIVYSGESNAAKLPKKYITETQDWSAEERKARLAVNFLFNEREKFGTTEENTKVSTNIVSSEAKKDLNAIATSNIVGVAWSYGLKEDKTKFSVADVHKNPEKFTWENKQGSVEKAEAYSFLNNKFKNDIPYGALRSYGAKATSKIEGHLKDKNKQKEVYVHVIDADAPNFSTQLPKELANPDGEKFKVLDAYKNMILKNEYPDFVIGGYNLTAAQSELGEADYTNTLKSNEIDTVIRRAVHQVVPAMTYPTEPNFLIKASTYKEIEGALKTNSNGFGDGTSEGSNLLDRYIKSKKLYEKEKIIYNPSAAVPTGVGGGGDRLLIKDGRKVDEYNINGKPQSSDLNVGDIIDIPEQYVVQAQSWSGASRLATAYFRAYAAVNGREIKINGKSARDTKSILAGYFSPVEQWVIALAKNNELPTFSLTKEVAEFDANEKNDEFKLAPILNKIFEYLKEYQDKLGQE